MFAAFDNFPALLIWFPILGAVLSFLIKREGMAKNISLASSILSLLVVAISYKYNSADHFALNGVSYIWMPQMGTSFSFVLDGLTRLMCLLTALAFPVALIVSDAKQVKQSNLFFALMMLTEAGLMGVFMATDALTFYFFWELALIPVYFLSSIWGGEKRIKATFKFFIYTFVGSLLLLVGILYMYMKTSDMNFGIVSFYNNVKLTPTEQHWLFILFFVAFAIKMPIFPLHTWQPEAYEQAPTPVTMILSGVMVKMGLFAVVRWLIPVFPGAAHDFQKPLVILIVIGVLYASLVAIYQDNIKRLIAYSSIAHIGLMAAGIFVVKNSSMQGALLQMFNHGINIIAMWVVAYLVETKTGVVNISSLGGIAQKAPKLAIFMVVAAIANIALPLTNSFVGEFMIFNGLYQYNPWVAAIAGISIVLAAVYTLNLVKNTFYGDATTSVASISDISNLQVLVLAVLTIVIFMLGVYPKIVLDTIQQTSDLILTRFN